MQVVVFCKHVLILYNNDSNVLTLKVARYLKYKVALIGETADAVNNNSFVKNTKIVVSLKYLSNFWRSLEMPLIN